MAFQNVDRWRTLAGSMALVALSTTAASCAVLRSLAGRNTVDLEGADVRSMGVDIRKQEKTICPREPVQMAVFADAVLRGETKLVKLETWAGGPEVSRNGKLDFAEFAFQSEQGTFDQNGWFTPSTELLTTVAREYELRTVFRRRPDKFSFTTTYKPDYRCIRETGVAAASGAPGQPGRTGDTGQSGAMGSSDAPGQPGTDGKPGGSGGSGGQGSNGPAISAWATFVKTPFYDKLVAVRVEGGARDFVLFHPESSIVLVARGGDGGGGGDGGRGGDGGSGGSGNPAGAGGNGAQGGNGGNGGNGGSGGSIELVFDERFPELERVIRLDVAGGSAGRAGLGGPGGSAGRGGGGLGNASSAADGNSGQAGADGAAGAPGPSGSSTARAGAVGDRFEGLSGVTLL